ncbi:transposase domain-containing protein, partial [Alkalibacter mobilis]|nr:transposase domain-containing protein [Alkalibacter mobilis]
MHQNLVETAKANGLNPYKYLEHLLTEIPSMDIQKNLESLDDLLPWN